MPSYLFIYVVVVVEKNIRLRRKNSCSRVIDNEDKYLGSFYQENYY